MAKRFTDTAKWEKPFFRMLSPKMKCAWIYICDRCNHAGVWDIDFDLMSIFIKETVTQKEFFYVFSEKIVVDGDKMFIPSFVSFQYGTLSQINKAHAAVIASLNKYRDFKPLESPLQGDKDKDKDKDKVKDKETVIEVSISNNHATFSNVYKKTISTARPNVNVTRGTNSEKRFLSQIKTPKDEKDLELAIKKYGEHLQAEQWRLPKMSFETFLGTKQSGFFWRDFIAAEEVGEEKKVIFGGEEVSFDRLLEKRFQISKL